MDKDTLDWMNKYSELLKEMVDQADEYHNALEVILKLQRTVFHLNELLNNKTK